MGFKKILIANRGEIAVRVLRSCREMGIDTVSVHSEEDESSLHVKLADESVCIGPARSSLSYMNIPAILSAAEITQADAIHPGLGFLSENREFAVACEKWNIAFIGPSPNILSSMGDKVLSKDIAKAAGVPVLAPILLDGLTETEIKQRVIEMGLPVIIKASAGGGGRGMRKITNVDDVLPSIKVLQEEALNFFGDPTLFIEKYISNPRHIEIQVIGDGKGNYLHLGERDCTIQRRFQKLVEESPSAVLSDKKRKEICRMAVKLSKAVKYNSVGTVEFLYDLDTENFYFMEMNTRIQVEHPVTEMRTGIDLIAEQIKLAEGEKLTLAQKSVQFRGHVMECRVNAENPYLGLPSPGTISYYHRPGGIGVRVDDYIYSGYRVSPYYDSMLAKIIVQAKDRPSCIKRMQRALEETLIKGISSNIDLHKRILRDRDFQENSYSTDFLNTKMG